MLLNLGPCIAWHAMRSIQIDYNSHEIKMQVVERCADSCISAATSDSVIAFKAAPTSAANR